MKKIYAVFLLIFLLCTINFSFDKIGLLYKGSEGEYGENMLNRYIVPVLEKWGLNFELTDVEKLDDFESAFKNYSGIISFYYSSKMKNPIEYLEALKNFLKKDGVYFFFNSVGAFATEEKIIEQKWINGPLNLMGIQYSDNWQNLKDFEIKALKDDYFKKDYTQPLEMPLETYNIFGKNVEIILSVKDNKREYPLIFNSQKGGGAVYNSFMTNNEVILNVEKFLEPLKIQLSTESENQILIITDKNNQNEKLNELSAEISLAGLKFELMSPEEIDQLRIKALSKFEVILVDTHSQLNKTLEQKFLDTGRTVVYFGDVDKSPWSDSMIKGKVTEIESFCFSDELSPLSNSEEGICVSWTFSINYDVQLSSENNLIAWFDRKERIPAIWFKELSNGRLGFIDKKILNKKTRGFVISSIMRMQETAIKSILNSFSLQLDDFIVPGFNREISYDTNKKTSDIDYYYDIWWPSIKKMIQDFDLQATIYPVLNYNSVDSYPFEFQDLNNDIQQRGYKILREIEENPRYEIGLHGYNHMHLIKENWKEKKPVVESLKRTLNFYSEVMGHDIILQSYVAPNNIIDDFGVDALLEAIPSISNIGTAYESLDKYSEYKLIGNDVVIIPRSTYGYYPVSKIIGNSMNRMASFGGFEHFIHADDVFATDRNPNMYSWEKMLDDMKSFYSKIQTVFPWLQSHTAAQHAELIKKYLKNEIKYIKASDEITVFLPPSTTDSNFFYLYTDKNIKNVKGGKIVWYYNLEHFYVLEMNTHKMNITFFE
jgi:hypothetical protein